MSDSLQPHGLQHTRLPCPSSSPRVHSNSRPLSQWCHLTISSSVAPFSPCFQSFPVSLVWAEVLRSLGRSQSRRSSVQSLSRVQLFATRGLQHARPPCPSQTPGACSNSCPSSWWCHPAITSSVIAFSSFLQSFRASGSFQMSQFFASGGQSTRVSAPALVLPMNFRTDFLRMDWLDLLAVQGTLKSLLKHHNSKTSILQHSAFSIVQLSYPYMTTGKTTAFIQTFLGNVSAF